MVYSRDQVVGKDLVVMVYILMNYHASIDIALL